MLGAGFAAGLAFIPRRRTVSQVAALAAAVLIALQLAVDHWFYLYLPWIAGLAFAGSVASVTTRAARPPGS